MLNFTMKEIEEAYKLTKQKFNKTMMDNSILSLLEIGKVDLEDCKWERGVVLFLC